MTWLETAAQLWVYMTLAGLAIGAIFFIVVLLFMARDLWKIWRQK